MFEYFNHAVRMGRVVRGVIPLQRVYALITLKCKTVSIIAELYTGTAAKLQKRTVRILTKKVANSSDGL